MGTVGRVAHPQGMTRVWTRGNEVALSEALLTLHQGATAASFPGVVMQAVAKLVPADACSYNELAPASHACASLMESHSSRDGQPKPPQVAAERGTGPRRHGGWGACISLLRRASG